MRIDVKKLKKRGITVSIRENGREVGLGLDTTVDVFVTEGRGLPDGVVEGIKQVLGNEMFVDVVLMKLTTDVQNFQIIEAIESDEE